MIMSPVLPYDGSVTIRGANRGKSIAVFLLQLQALLWVCGVAMASAWIGQPLSDALKSLQRRDFSIIFSTELVPDALRVT
jgi:hypothetical protein